MAPHTSPPANGNDAAAPSFGTPVGASRITVPNTENDALAREARTAAKSCKRVYATARETPGMRDATRPPYTIMSLDTTYACASRGASSRSQRRIPAESPGVRYRPSSGRGGSTTRTPATAPRSLGSCAVTGRSSSGTTTNVTASRDEKSAAMECTAAPYSSPVRLTLEAVEAVAVRVGHEDLVGFADAERLRELDVDRRAGLEVLRLDALAVGEKRREVGRV